MDIDALKQRFIRCFSLAADNAVPEKAFDDVLARYSEKHRYYHTLDHVAGCLDAFDEVAHAIASPFCVEAALWFHDVIYNPVKGDNEKMSAEYARNFLHKIKVAPDDIDTIGHLIMLTCHPSHPQTDDEKYLVDIDLSILAANESLYAMYEGWIRQEYAFVPGFLYRRGRKKLLKSFLAEPRLFHSDYFHDRNEARARKNIEMALGQL